MANNAKVMGSIKAFLERMKACDESIPEELADDALEMVEGVKDALCEDEEADVLEVTKDGDCSMQDKALDKKIEDSLVKVMRKYGMIKDESMKAIDECLEEATKDEEIDLVEETKDADGEEEVLVDPETVKDSAKEVRKYVEAIKPIIAAIPNAKDRKRASDSIANIIKLSRGNQYGDILKASRQAAKDEAAKKQNTVQTADADFDLGRTWAEKFNPHYMKEVK